MANQNVPSSSFSSTPSWTYDVFLSFRGEDTRTNFTDHLYHAFVRHGINTFIDYRELPTGEKISPTLLEAIEKSRIAVIIFSENYASSRWCLDELVHILECRKSRGQMTRPIFYKVDPSDVRHQTNSYGAAFADHSRKYENDAAKVQRWRTALTEAANLKGATLNEGEYETTFIKNIVAEISTKVLLNPPYLHVADYPVGIESCAKEVEVLLDVGGNDRRVVGIWGTSGIGKTTIAKDVYNAIAHKFEGSCFLADVSETSASREGLIQLQKTLLSKILGGAELNFVNAHEGTSLIKNRLRQKKILLILDDVDKLERLKDWIDVDCFGEGSRVVITTKDRKLLKFYGGQWIYEVQKLRYDKALELFSWNAFKRNRPPDDYLSLAQRAIVHAQGLPLALNLIGSHLRNESIDRWQDVLNSYDSYDEKPYTDIQIILRKTYDAWDYKLQQVFLDIACFFKGENKDYVLQLLRSSTLNVHQHIIDVLVEKAIIALEHNQILMHNLLEKMGKRIVYEESPTEPGRRSRLWHHDDVREVLIDCKGTEKIGGIVVNLPEPEVITLNAESFSKMENLELFINRDANFSGRVDYLPNSLRWIDLGGRSIVDIKHTVVLNLSSNFHPRNLVCFNVPHSGIRHLKGFKNLAKLTRMNLRGCEFLEKMPDLSGSPNIIELDLSGCTSLVEVDDSVGFLDKLERLNLSKCSKLTRFPTRLGLRSLIWLNLCGCTRLERFPEIEKNKMKSLTYLYIEESGIRELPSSIAYLTGLTNLYADGCELQNVPDLSPNIRVLNLSYCTSLVEVDDSVGFLDKLERLNLSKCSKLTRFPTRLGLRSLISLDLRGCTRLERFPEIEKNKMKSLKYLYIGKSGIRELPSSIAYLTGLLELNAFGCELQNVPDLSGSPDIRVLNLSYCTSLVEVDDSVGFLDKLERLHLSGCSKLTRFPTRLGLRSLYELDLGGCRRLESFPEILNSLKCLYIGESGIRELPPIAYFTGFTTLDANGWELQNVKFLPNGKRVKSDEVSSWMSPDIRLLPDGKKVKFDEVSSWLSLDLSGCKLSESDFFVPLDCWSTLRKLDLSRNNFVSLPDCISKAVNMEILLLSDCKTLREIPVLPPKLWQLDLDGCISLDKIPVLPPRLWQLDLDGCISLDKIPTLPPMLKHLKLCHCSGLSDDEVAKLENEWLNEDILVARLENNKVLKLENVWRDELYPHLSIIYPGNEVPKWFSYTSNHPTTIQPLPEREWDEWDEWDEEDMKEEFVGGSEFRFEIPLKLQEGEELLGLALSYVLEPFTYNRWSDETDILINGKIQLENFRFNHGDLKATHVWLALVDELWYDEDKDICQVEFRFGKGCPIKSCGVHCLLRNQDSGSSYSEDEDEEDEEREQEQPSDSDIEEDEDEEQEQEQPRLADSGSDGISQQDLQTNSNMVPTAGRQLAKSLELQSLHDSGFSKRYVRCLQISKIVNSMKDLFDFCRENKVGPIEGLKVYPRHATAAKLQMQKMQEMEQLASAQGLPTDRNTLNKLMALHPGLNNQMNNHHQMVGPGAYQNLLLRHNSMNSNANSLQQEASSSFNNSNRIPSSTFQGAAALIPGSMHNLPGSALSSAHLPSRQPQQLQQRSLSSNSLLQQTHSTGSQGNQALQQQMIQQLPQEMSNNSRGGQQSLPCPSANGSVGRNGVSFGGNNVPGSHGPAPSRNNSFKAPANSDNSTGGGGNNTYNQRAPDLPSNLHLQEDLVQEIAREFTENGFFNSNRDDNMYPQISSDIVLRPTSSLGKRPHPRGSSDIVDDEYDHPKRRQIEIEEEEEQEQPFASDDPQFQIS
nr:candidate crown gall disease resistance protein 4 [Malus hybrid cultivar]